MRWCRPCLRVRALRLAGMVSGLVVQSHPQLFARETVQAKSLRGSRPSLSACEGVYACGEHRKREDDRGQWAGAGAGDCAAPGPGSRVRAGYVRRGRLRRRFAATTPPIPPPRIGIVCSFTPCPLPVQKTRTLSAEAVFSVSSSSVLRRLPATISVSVIPRASMQVPQRSTSPLRPRSPLSIRSTL